MAESKEFRLLNVAVAETLAGGNLELEGTLAWRFGRSAGAKICCVDPAYFQPDTTVFLCGYPGKLATGALFMGDNSIALFGGYTGTIYKVVYI